MLSAQSKKQPEAQWQAALLHRLSHALTCYVGAEPPRHSPRPSKGGETQHFLQRMPPLAQLERTRKNGILLPRC